MEKGGIAIRDFEKLSTDEGFAGACSIFKSRLNGEDEARAFAGLSNLDAFKDSTKHPEFIEKVGSALNFIANRKLNRALRKARKAEGVALLYEDEKCFIVTPDGPDSSNRAAYLDNGTANWCIALKDGEKVDAFWKNYDTNRVFYIYLKDKTDSWAMVVNNYTAFLMNLPGSRGEQFPSLIENRDNGTGESRKKIAAEYRRMLKKTGLRSGFVKKMVAGNANRVDFASDKSVSRSIADKVKGNFFKLAARTDFNSFTKGVRSCFLYEAVNQGRLDVLRHLIKKEGIEYETYYKDAFTFTHEDGTERHCPARWESGSLLLFEAIYDIKCFKYLLDLGMDPNSKRRLLNSIDNSDMGVYRSVLHSAIINHKYEVVRLLLERGASYEREIKELEERQIAFSDESLPLLKLLLELGYNLDATDLIDRCAPCAGGFCSRSIVKLLSFLYERGYCYDETREERKPQRRGLAWVGNGRDSDPLFDFLFGSEYWLRAGSPDENELGEFMETAELLLKLGVPVNRKVGTWRPLNSAVRSRYAPIVKLLLEHGARPGDAIRREWKDCSKGPVVTLSDEIASLLERYNIPVED